MIKNLAFVICIVVASPAGGAEFADEKLDNWHQWRGPNADGVAPRGDPPLKWDESHNIAWKARIPGSGSSTPIVWGDRIFILTAIDTDKLPPLDADSAAAEEPRTAESDPAARTSPNNQGGAKADRRRGRGKKGAPALSTSTPKTLYRFDVLCLDRATGKTLWQQTAHEAVPHEGHHPSHDYASASPTTDGQRLYVSFGSHGVYCFDFEGKMIWSRDLGQMETKRGFGEGASPVLYGDSLVVNWDHEGESFITCLDADTGQDRWRTRREEGTTWGTPLIVEGGGRTQVVVNATARTCSYDLATGKLLWKCGGQVENPIPSPVAGYGMVFCMTGYLGYSINAIQLDAQGDVTGGDKCRWHYSKSAPYVASPLLYGNLLYFTKGDVGILSCLDAGTGQPIYPTKRLEGLGTIYASPVGTAGRVYITDRNGATAVVEQGPQRTVLAVNKLDDVFNASPVVVGRELLLRGEEFLYSIVHQE